MAEDLGLVTSGWSVSAHDGIAGASADRVVARVRRGLRDGAIVLMHDASERGTHTPVAAEAIARIVAAGSARRASMSCRSTAWIEALS